LQPTAAVTTTASMMNGFLQTIRLLAEGTHLTTLQTTHHIPNHHPQQQQNKMKK